MNVQSKIPKTFRNMIKYRAGALALIGILSSTYLHTTTFMAQFFYHSIILGGIAALAIDAGVVAMSVFKDELLKDGELAWMVRVVTSLVLVASGIANMSEGFKSAYGIALTLESLMALDWITWSQWLAGTIIFPVLAYVMCDTVGTRNLAELRSQEGTPPKYTPKKEFHPHQPEMNGQPIGFHRAGTPPLTVQKEPNKDLYSANKKIRRNKAERMQMLEEHLSEHPDSSLTQMAKAISVASTETVKRYLAEMGLESKGQREYRG